MSKDVDKHFSEYENLGCSHNRGIRVSSGRSRGSLKWYNNHMGKL